MNVSNIYVCNVINRRLGGQTQIINRAVVMTLELYGIKYNHIMICTNYVNLYDIKIEFFWDVKPCTLVDLRQSAGDFSTSRVAVYVSSDHR